MMDMMTMVRVGLFVAITVPIVAVSVSSLRHPGSHGFYRFFAWEAIALLFVLNYPRWFVDPFSPVQLVSWFLLFAGLGLVIEAVRLMRKLGGAREGEHEHGEYEWEQTTELVTTGLFRWIRHPMYSSLLFLTWGIFCKDATIPAGAAAIAATALLYATAKADEHEDVAKFGDAYTEYMRGTKRFIPWVW